MDHPEDYDAILLWSTSLTTQCLLDEMSTGEIGARIIEVDRMLLGQESRDTSQIRHNCFAIVEFRNQKAVVTVEDRLSEEPIEMPPNW